MEEAQWAVGIERDLELEGMGGWVDLEVTGEDGQGVGAFEGGVFKDRRAVEFEGEDDALLAEVEAFPAGAGPGEGAIGKGARVGEVAVVGVAGEGGVAEDLASLDGWVGPVFAVEDNAFEGNEIAGPAGGIAEEIGVEEDGGGGLVGGGGGEADGDAFAGNVGAGFRGFDGGGEEGAVVHVAPGLAGFGFGVGGVGGGGWEEGSEEGAAGQEREGDDGAGAWLARVAGKWRRLLGKEASGREWEHRLHGREDNSRQERRPNNQSERCQVRSRLHSATGLVQWSDPEPAAPPSRCFRIRQAP